MSRRLPKLAAWACTCAVAGAGAIACRPARDPAPVARPAGATVPAPAFDLPAVVARARLAFRRGADGGLEAAGAGWRARVDGSGAVAIRPLTAVGSGAALVLAPATFSRGGGRRASGKPAAQRDGALAIARGPAMERLRSTGAGLEQTWRFEERPAGRGALRVRVPASGLRFAGATPGGLHFRDPATGLGVRYGHATWVDAAGSRTPVEARWTGTEIALAIPESLVERGPYPAVLDPVVSPESDVDAPIVAGAPDAQRSPAVAFDGTVFLAAWVDRRVEGTGAVWAARVALDGTLLDPAGIPVAVSDGDRESVAVAAGGGTFLVAWRERDGFDSSKVWTARVSPDGSVPDSPLLLGTAGTGSPASTAAAFDGQQYRLAWTGLDPWEQTCTLSVAAVAADGTLAAAPRGVAGGYGCKLAPQVALACEGDACLAAWERIGGIATHLVTRAGGAGATTSVAGPASHPAAAWDGTQYLLAWEDDAVAGRADVRGRRISAAGVAVDVQPLPFTASGTAHAPALAFDGTSHLLVWEDRTAAGSDLRGLRVGSDGVPVDALQLDVSAAPGAQYAAQVAAGPAGSLVVFEDTRSDSAGDVYAARVSPVGAVLDPEGLLLSRSVNRQLHPAAAFDGTAWLVVWEDSRDSGSREAGVWGLRVARDGTPIDPAAFAIADGLAAERFPAVAGCGGHWTVAWEDHRAGGGTDVYAARVLADGTNLDPAGVLVAGGAASAARPAVACAGELALVAWHEPPAYAPGRVAAARVSGDGTVLDPGGVKLSSRTGGTRPSVAAGGGGFVVAWQSGDGILSARVGADGAVGTETSVCTRTAPRGVPTVAFDGAGFQVAFDGGPSDGRVWTARLDAVGAVRDWCGAELPGAGPARDTRTAFDGTRYVAAWSDPVAGGLGGASYAPGGGLLETFPIAAGPEPQRSPDVACDGAGACLVASERHDAAGGATRLRIRLVTGPAPAPRCTAPADCSSGFCVDGVCCDTECGGGAPGDCLACSVATGAPADGRCAPAVRGTLCRGGSPCDAPERCDGAATACPADLARPDGEACDDLDRCTTSDRCVSGACVADAVVCPAPPVCTTSACDPETGTCGTEALPEGTPCDDGNGCTQGDRCVLVLRDWWTIECRGAPKACPTDACHVGICDPATGACGQVPTWDGAWCDDGSACTTDDRCDAGRCAGTPVVCPAAGPCQQAGLCDRATGACAYAPRPDGLACDDGNACTRADACAAGACVGADPVTCVAVDACHEAGACDPATGTCSTPARPDGAACDDGDACTRADACVAGTCLGSSPVVCAPLDGCHEAGTCDPATGACSSPSKPDGAACDDGDACTRADACAAGTCVGADPVTCPAPSDPCTVAACAPGTGQCGSAPAVNGTPCPGGACRDGACVASPPEPAGGCGCGASGTGSATLLLALAALWAPRRRSARLRPSR